jgi:hypothetical protein
MTTTMSAVAAQPVRALGAANTRRTRVAELKRRLRAHELTVTRLILDPPTDLERYLTWEVLLWTPGLGRARLRALNARALRYGHVNLAAPLGALTARQRQWLADQLDGHRRSRP